MDKNNQNNPQQSDSKASAGQAGERSNNHVKWPTGMPSAGGAEQGNESITQPPLVQNALRPTSQVSAVSQSQPPATQPPATQPPATQPPATQPPATQPPATQPPATPPASTTPPKKSKKSNRMLIGCFGGLGGIILLAIIALIILMSQTGPEGSPVLELLGIKAANVHSILILVSNVLFGMLVFITFLLAIIGIFRFSMVKKDDTSGRKKGFSLFIVGAILFIVFIFLWITVYLYLQSKIPETMPEQIDYIQTEPESTIGLTAPIQISFDASEIPVDETKYKIISYNWDFGDKETATGQKVKHTYKRKGEKDGRYKAVLTIIYLDLKTNEEGEAIFPRDVVFDNEKVKAMFSVSELTGNAPFKVYVDASESLDPDGEIISYEWDFDEDASYDDAEGVEASYVYEQIGTYEISLRVTDNNEEYDTVEQTVQVIASEVQTAVITHASKDEIFYVGTGYTFEAGNSWSPFGDIEKYEWDFGDGSKPEKTRTVQHAFKNEGKYTIIMKITDESGQSAETTLKIIVTYPESAPVPILKTIPEYTEDEEGDLTLTGTAPLSVQFDVSGSTDPDENIVDYQWDFNGDGEIDEIGAQTAYTFEKVGQYNVTVFVIDAKNNQSTVNLLVNVEEQGLSAQITADPIDGVTPLTVNFDASGSSYQEGKIVSYEWNFGDGTETRIADAIISHRYSDIGTFTAILTVIASDGKRTKTSLDINVRPIPLTACFEANVKEGTAPLTVTFNPNCSTGTIITYSWDFSGETSRERKPTHTFENAGIYEVTLEIADNDNVIDRFTDTIVVKGEVE